MMHSSANLLRPTIWMSRADLDRLRALEARMAAEPGDSREPELGAPRVAVDYAVAG